VTRETPEIPSGENPEQLIHPQAKDEDKRGIGKRFANGIRKLSSIRLGGGETYESLLEKHKELEVQLDAAKEEEIKARIQRSRFLKILDKGKAIVLSRKKQRLELQELILEKRKKVREAHDVADEGTDAEIPALEKKIADLESDVDTLRESLRLHLRDRIAVQESLGKSREELQDLLTESLLWKIHHAEIDSDTDVGTGVIAELLGRVLVLEKEESRLRGTLENRKNNDIN
jgi:hypothetical protein